MTGAFWLCAAITALSALVSLGYSAAALRRTGEAHISALYTFARSLALAVVSVMSLVEGSRQWLLATATAMIIVQAVDAYAGRKQHDTRKTYGPAGLALANLAALILLIV